MGSKDKKNLSIIDKELTIEGSISSSGKLIIKGRITGTIKGDVIIIAEDGEVNSEEAKVSSLTIGGKFHGNVTATKELVILSTGTCSGKVECKDLIVENGGILNAEVSCKASAKLEKGKDALSYMKKEEKKSDQAIEL